MKGESKQESGLSRSTYIGYGVGDFAMNLYFQAALVFLLKFYTDTVGLAAASVAGVFLVARIVDAVTDPMMGVIADRTRSRWGKLRPYLITGAPFLAVMGAATFSTPDWDADGKLIYAYVTYILFGIAYTIVGIPYSSLTASLTRDSHERTKLSSVRMAFALVGVIVVTVGMVQGVEALGGGLEAHQLSMGAFAILATVLLIWTFMATEEKYYDHDATAPGLSDSLRALSGNLPLMMMLVAFLFAMIANTVRSAAILYYFEYNIGDKSLVDVFMAVTGLSVAVGLVLTTLSSKYLGKKTTFIGGSLIGVIAGFALYVTPYDQIEMIFAISVIAGISLAAPMVLGWAMLPDTVEYTEWKKGVRIQGSIYALASFSHKLAMAVGGAFAAMILAFVGYVPNEVQSAEAQTGIAFMMAAAPAIALLIGTVAIWFYPLDEETHRQITEELAVRAAD